MTRIWCAVALAVVMFVLLATPAYGTAIYAVDAANNFLAFNSATPGTVTNFGPMGIPAGETVLGMDARASSGAIVVVTRDAAGTGRIYRVNPASGDVVGSGVALAADPADMSPFVTLANSTYGVDFNPAVDRLRLVNANEENMRINVDTGLVITDTNLSPAAGYTSPNNSVAAAAYTSNFPGATTTTLYGHNHFPDDVITINPPNGGILNFVGDSGFVANNSQRLHMDVAPDGQAYLSAFTNAIGDRLFRVDLSTGAATPVGLIGAGTLDIRGMTATTQNILQFGSAAVTGAENGATITLNVTRANATDAMTVNVTSADGSATAGSDYEAVSQMLSFSAGEVSETVSVNVLDDAADEASEHLTLTLSTAAVFASIAVPTATVTIADDDQPPVTVAPPPAGPPPPPVAPELKAGDCANERRGTSGDDALAGTSAGDKLLGLAGDDGLTGLTGNDCLDGGAGGDFLSGGAGNDKVTGGAGDDRLSGGAGGDTISTGRGVNVVLAGAGNDKISAKNRKRDVIDCGKGRDRVTADRADRLRGCETVKR